MAARVREKTYYKISFSNEDELYQVCARHVSTSDLYGLIEIGDFIFPASNLVYNPGEERLRREFEGIKRTWIPYHAIVRIDEIFESRKSEIKIIPLESPANRGKRDPRKEGPLKKPEA